MAQFSVHKSKESKIQIVLSLSRRCSVRLAIRHIDARSSAAHKADGISKEADS